MSRLLTLGEASEELHVSKDTLRRLAARGELKIVRVSRRVLTPMSEILRISEHGAGKYAQTAKVVRG